MGDDSSRDEGILTPDDLDVSEDDSVEQLDENRFFVSVSEEDRDDDPADRDPTDVATRATDATADPTDPFDSPGGGGPAPGTEPGHGASSPAATGGEEPVSRVPPGTETSATPESSRDAGSPTEPSRDAGSPTEPSRDAASTPGPGRDASTGDRSDPERSDPDGRVGLDDLAGDDRTSDTRQPQSLVDAVTDAPGHYAIAAAVRTDAGVADHRCSSNNVAETFEQFLRWYADRVGDGRATQEEVLRILLAETDLDV